MILLRITSQPRLDQLITELEIRRALDGLNPHKAAGLPQALKALKSHIAPVLARMFNLSLQTAQVPEDGRHAIVTPAAKTPRTTNPRQFRHVQPHVCRLQNP